NRDKLSIYVRATPHGRRDFEQRLDQWAEVEQTYPNPDEKPANSLLSDSHAAFLTPRRGKLLRLRVFDGQLEPLLRAYLPRKATGSDVRQESEGATAPGDPPVGSGDAASEMQAESPAPRRRQVSVEELQRALDRNDAT